VDLSVAVAQITPLQIPQHGGVGGQTLLNFLVGSFGLHSFLVMEGCVLRDLGRTLLIITRRSPNWLSVLLLRDKLITISSDRYQTTTGQ
jgi:hypothetical protein